MRTPCRSYLGGNPVAESIPETCNLHTTPRDRAVRTCVIRCFLRCFLQWAPVGLPSGFRAAYFGSFSAGSFLSALVSACSCLFPVGGFPSASVFSGSPLSFRSASCSFLFGPPFHSGRFPVVFCLPVSFPGFSFEGPVCFPLLLQSRLPFGCSVRSIASFPVFSGSKRRASMGCRRIRISSLRPAGGCADGWRSGRSKS